MRTIKVRRLIEYSGNAEDVERHLGNTLLSKSRAISPGDTVPGVGPIMAGVRAPKVSIRLVSETESNSGATAIWRERK